MTLLVDVSGVSSRVSCGTNTVGVTISIARATRSMRGLAPAPDALASVAAKKINHRPLTSAFTPSRRARVRGWRRSSTKTVARRALSARAATSVVARAWEPSVGGAPGSPPGASRVTVSGVARSRCVREGRKNGSDTCRAVTRGTLTWPERRSSAICGTRPRGDLPSGSIAASGASEGAHTHLIWSSLDSSISSSDEYALSSEWAMSRVAREFGKSTCADGTRLRLASSRALRGGAGFAVCA